MKFTRLFILTLLVCVNSIGLSAQENSFYHYGLEQGLSQQTIRCILKDSKGFLWLGTQDGLNRFDGNSFRVFRKQESDSRSISGKFINDILESDDGNIWIATANNGLCYYDPLTDVFTRTKFNSGNCTSLVKDNFGNIYASSLNKGLFIYSKKAEGYKMTQIKSINSRTELLSSTLIINTDLYLGTAEGHIFKTDISKNSIEEFKQMGVPKALGIINDMYVYDNDIILGTSNGLFKFQPEKELLFNLNLKQYDAKVTENIVVESIASKNNMLYVGTDNGLFLLKDFDEGTQKFKNNIVYKGDKDNINSITSSRVYDILIDDDLLWIGTNNLDVASLVPPVFKTINTFSSPAINNNYVFSILKTKDYLFIGTRDGLNCIDLSGQVHVISKENTNQTLAYNVIRGMAIDSQNMLWLATTKGVSIIELDNFNPQNPKIISLFSDDTDTTSLSNNKTRGVYLDHNDHVWITTYGGGINRFTGDLAKGIYSFERYMFDPNTDSISSNFTFNITQDPDKNYWITSNNGLHKLEFKSDDYSEPIFTSYINDKSDSRSLQSNTTLHTHHDQQGILWVATQNGLHKYDKTNASFTPYNESHGLRNTYVYSILEDNEQQLWVSTNAGLYRFDKANERFINFTLKDGVQSTEFNLGAHYRDPESNQLYFGGINGFNVFNPKTIDQLDTKGELFFTELRIKDTIINPITHPKNLDQSITNSKIIQLNWNDFPCTLKFSDLNLHPQKNTKFVYRLNATNWNAVNDSREIQLLDLPKGKHTIAIQGMSRNTIWDTQPLELTIKVSPPWFKSNLAYLFYLFLFFSIIYLFYRMSLRQQLAGQETKRLKELDDLKSRFITNITHEFRTPLTIIMGYIETLKGALSQDKQYTKPLKSIEKNSKNLLTLVNEMMDLAKLKQGGLALNTTQQDIVSLTKYLADSFSSLAESKTITINFNSKVETLIMDFDIEKYRQIITNLISNAIKFSESDSRIEVLLTTTKTDQIRIEVSDQGKGIPEDELPFIFDRFYQATTSAFKKNRGTGIGLALTQELVQLMKGTIVATSQKDKGTTFSLMLPITNTADLKDNPSKIKTQKVSTYNLDNLEQPIKNKDLPTVLVVEDNEEIAHYIGTCLADSYNLLFALNGQIGFEISENQIPDIIITDVMMPIMDGYELTDKLQNTKPTNHIPIIMLTAKAQQEDKIVGLKSGADAYLTKPFQKEELLVRINSLIEKRQKLQERYSLKRIISIDTSSLKADKNLEFLDSIIQHIHKNIENADYNAPKLASDVFMSESQLYRKLKAITNKSSAIFIRSVRLEKAKELLQNTTLSVSEVAYATGFNNPNWFGKAFKEEFGVNPSEIKSE